MTIECTMCDKEINVGDKFGKIAIYSNDIFEGFSYNCYSCASYYIKDFEQDEKWNTYENTEYMERLK